MTATFPNSDLLAVEADFLVYQTDLLRNVASDIHSAADILGYEAYDLESRSICLRRDAWHMRSEEAHGTVAAAGDGRRDQDKASRRIHLAARLMDAARQAKTDLKCLVEIVCAARLLETNQDRVKIDVKNEEEKEESVDRKGHLSIHGHDTTACTDIAEVKAAGLTSVKTSKLNDGLCMQTLAQKDGAFPAPGPVSVASTRKQRQQQKHWNVDISDTSGTLVDSDIDLDDRGWKKAGTRLTNKRSYAQMEVDQTPVTKDATIDSQPQTLQETDKEDVLAWIPPKFDISRRSVHVAANQHLQSLMMQQSKRARMERAS
jgi:hypothetical protein